MRGKDSQIVRAIGVTQYDFEHRTEKYWKAIKEIKRDIRKNPGRAIPTIKGYKGISK